MKLPKELRDRQDLGGTQVKGKNCSVRGCSELAIRSLSENKWKKYVEKADLQIYENKQRKIYLCKNHYKESNKIRKSDEKYYHKKGFLEDSKAIGRSKRWD